MRQDIAVYELEILLNHKLKLDLGGRNSYDCEKRIKELREFLDSLGEEPPTYKIETQTKTDEIPF